MWFIFFVFFSVQRVRAAAGGGRAPGGVQRVAGGHGGALRASRRPQEQGACAQGGPCLPPHLVLLRHARHQRHDAPLCPELRSVLFVLIIIVFTSFFSQISGVGRSMSLLLWCLSPANSSLMSSTLMLSYKPCLHVFLGLPVGLVAFTSKFIAGLTMWSFLAAHHVAEPSQICPSYHHHSIHNNWHNKVFQVLQVFQGGVVMRGVALKAVG